MQPLCVRGAVDITGRSVYQLKKKTPDKRLRDFLFRGIVGEGTGVDLLVDE